MIIPKLKPSKRKREYNNYSFNEKSRVVKAWLFDKHSSHRDIDRNILSLDPSYSKGFQSMNILHYLGLKKDFNGLFEGISIEKTVNFLQKDKQNFLNIISYIKNEETDNDYIVSEALFDFGKKINKDFSKSYLKRLKEMTATDNISNKGHTRKEQAALRTILFKNNDKIECALCQKLLPSQIMIAAHIKPRSKCSIKERKDPNIVMPLCKIGCDDLFEKGYIKVIKSGIIKINTNKKITSELKSFMKQYKNKKCTYYNNNTKNYFNFRNKLD